MIIKKRINSKMKMTFNFFKMYVSVSGDDDIYKIVNGIKTDVLILRILVT